jgi:magnesium chelatase subunit I
VLASRVGDRGLADEVRFPFLALVSQAEMKLALVLTLINPAAGGVLLVGPRGTGKTTAVRGLVDLLPQVQRSTCPNGCEPQAAEIEGMDGVCPLCAAKLVRGEPITAPDRMRLVELPLNARLDDVVGGIDERVALEQHKVRLERGLLAMADQNLLYVDEVNLLANEIVDAILDAAAQGLYTARRGPLAATYRARVVLVGSMNPEEGKLRPQIQDRFGLRVLVRGLTDSQDRLEVYRRVSAYQVNPYALRATWAGETLAAAGEIAVARAHLPQVKLTPQVERTGMAWVKRLGIDSHRAEVVLFEAARAHAAADGRTQADLADLRTVAAMALRQRRSRFMDDYFAAQQDEEREMASIMRGSTRTRPRTRR